MEALKAKITKELEGQQYFVLIAIRDPKREKLEWCTVTDKFPWADMFKPLKWAREWAIKGLEGLSSRSEKQLNG